MGRSFDIAQLGSAPSANDRGSIGSVLSDAPATTVDIAGRAFDDARSHAIWMGVGIAALRAVFLVFCGPRREA